MSRSTSWRAVVVTGAIALAACGSDTTATDDPAPGRSDDSDAPSVADGEAVEDRVTTTVDDVEAVAENVTVIEVSVRDGRVDGGGRHSVPLGDTVTLRVTSDTADEVHVHGYDVTVDAPAGETVDVTFVADIPGVFEVELEAEHLPLVELEIS